MQLCAKKCSIKNGNFSVNCDFVISKGEHLALFGPSGTGKSTVLLGLSGFLPLTAGELLYGNKTLLSLEPKDRPIDILFQENNLFPHISVAQNVVLGLGPNARMTRENKELVYKILKKVDLFQERDRLPENISGGQRSRVAIARSLLRKKPILLLDEPFSALDFVLKKEILKLLKSIAKKDKLSIFLVSHDPRDIKFLGGDVLYFLGKGETKFYKKYAFHNKFSKKLEI